MTNISLPKITVFEYSKQWKRLLYICGTVFIIFFLACIAWSIFGNQQQDFYVFLIIGFLFFLLGFFSILVARKTRISLLESSIIQDGILWKKEIFYTDITGFTLANTNYTLDYHLKTNTTKVHIYSAFENSNILIQWMSDSFVDLDKKEEDEMDKMISSGDKDILLNLPKKEKIVQIIWTYIPWWLLIGFFFSKNPILNEYLLIVAFFYPIISLFLAKYWLWNRTPYFTTEIGRSKSSKNGAHPLMMAIFWMPLLIGLALIFRSYESIVSFWLHELKIISTTTILYSLFIYKFFPEIFWNKKTFSVMMEKIIWMIFAFFIIWGFLIHFNSSLDKNNSIENKASSVIEKDISESSKWWKTYNLTISDWKNPGNTKNLTVDSKLYEETSVGNDVEIQIYPWRFGIKWFKSIIYTNTSSSQ